MATVLLGTLYPLLMEATGLASLSVGAPYFNRVLYPLLLLGMVLMGLAPFSLWGKTVFPSRRHWRYALVSFASAVILSLFFTLHWNTLVILNLTLVFWVLLSLPSYFLDKLGMSFAHGGFALVVLSIALSSSFSQEREVRLHTGESVNLGPYAIRFVSVSGLEGSNFRGIGARVAVTRRGQLITTLYPEKRIYPVRDMVMSKVDIYPALFHDLYVALGEPFTEEEWSMRLYYKPFIRWLWFGGFCMAFGGLISLLGARKK